jgi:mannose-6-phosphate isomerase-like protein (cupin superfamily)
MRLGFQEALSRVPSAKSERFAVVFERGSVSVEVYAPRGMDPQSPHSRDEIYVVAQGQGTFVCTDRIASSAQRTSCSCRPE